VLGACLNIASYLRDRQFSQTQNDIVRLNAEDIKALGLDTPSATDLDKRIYINNMSYNQATQVAGDIGEQTWREASTRQVSDRRYEGNKAHGNSRQVMGNMSAEVAKNLRK